MGAFVLNRRGFKNPPTDYYSRPYSVAVETLNFRHRTHCIGPKLEMEVYFDYLKNFVSTMERQTLFTFTFVARLTHDIIKYAGFADKPSYELATYLKENAILNRSLLYSSVTMEFGLVIFEEHTLNLETNRNRLTTPYDIHATLLHLLDLERETFYTLHGQSLLTEISPERTCADAMIAKHWCTCQTHKIVSTDDANVRQAALSVVRKLNRLLKPYLKLCAPLKMSKVLDARIVQPSESFGRSSTQGLFNHLDSYS
ncbi:uncharacterized protein CEXT_211081 [Caerostris extrusa]|uniref:Uncharacterized protein n=1 Tax=Caerostris extrusa TaxID=172846 RepID=A0AAV4M5Q5_CAEEX|nr:uncharacterized protein CEXT_211081 [Caerostris extrusa]